ncbi:Arp2/3 complex, 34 kd subunit p34-Arc-domain-containing protein [Radiomyces spectabilis]|uniref:Arp2/3 complex, 34 kd subunit p34-Arc-domain-containing protein n=1 Tax=Radiomyces spectabilis TaxID=64574 RepID=UPI002221085F|nr:Arp2/3 complex, 34 kd subunit p34-Arc-domain-containing protein [Radiomyces spectabilis]KAI8364655.1 Arp2/3 complex, 34 kd subunit p34-Arc-domain-containing protein [Radiomyces spectabilis]
MLLLDYHNVILKNILEERLKGDKRDALDMTVVDFDGVTYYVTTPETKTVLHISLQWACFKELVGYGAQEVLQREYGEYLASSPEQGYDVTLVIDLEKVPQDEETRDALIRKVSLLKRNLLAAPFERAFAEQGDYNDDAKPNPTSELMTVHYREEEAIHIKSSTDRVTVIFSTKFKDETDKIFGKVFLQEFVDARRRPALQNAPQVLYSIREPPMELRHLNLNDSDDTSYITFVLFPQHFTNGDVREETISRIQVFRDYLHYHIKCSKAYMHTRMRARVRDFLRVLNRAKPENTNVEKKTASGRTFRRS